VIAAVTHMRSLTGRVIGNRLFNWVGLRSYGLYLYHWPIYQFIRKEAGIKLTLAQFALAMVLTFAIAEVSYRWIETPIRTGRLSAWIRTNLRGRPTPQVALRRRRALAGGVLAMAIPVFAGISLAFAPLRQSDVAQSLAAGQDSVTNVLDGTAEPVGLPSTDAPVVTTTPTVDSTLPVDPNATTLPVDPNATTLPVDPNATTLPVDPNATTLPVDPNATAAPATVVPPVDTTPASTNPPAVVDVMAIGDSVMLGAAPALSAKGAVVDARVNRQGTEGADMVEALRDMGALPNVLVIHLGTNGPASQKTYDRIVTAAASVPTILFLTVRADRVWTADNNQRIHDLEVRYPGQVHILDWAEVSNQCPGDCFYGDNIHLKPTGQQFYADQVWAAIGR